MMGLCESIKSSSLAESSANELVIVANSKIDITINLILIDSSFQSLFGVDRPSLLED
jgi:hypothetical protein